MSKTMLESPRPLESPVEFDRGDYPPSIALARRRSSAAPQDRPHSFLSTGGTVTPLDVTGGKTFLLPQTLEPALVHAPRDAPVIPALERPDLCAPNSEVDVPRPSGDTVSPTRLEGGSPEHATRSFLEGRSNAFKALFVVTACSAQLIAQGQFGMVVIPLKEIGVWLGTEDPGELSWMAAAYGLTVGMFLVASGRLGDLYGPKLLWLLGYGVVIAANLGSGFCSTPIPFNVTRAIGGIGAAMAVPNAVAMLARTFPPSRTRSLVFAILGALAPVGFLAAGVVGALFADYGHVPWIYFFTALFTVAFGTLGIVVLPPDDPIPPRSARRGYDYIGTLLLVAALGLFNFAWNQAPLVKWSAPYVWSLLLVSILCFVAFYFWERRVGKNALIPVEVLSREACLTYLSLFLGWMSFGVFLLYTTLFIRNVRGVDTALGLCAQMSPVMPTGILAALLVPTLITRFPGDKIFLVSMVSFLAGDVMASVAPAHGSYWSVTFPSLIIVIFGPDLSFATGQLIVSNSVDREFQGIAAGIVSMITNYSLSIGLGMAGTVEVYTYPNGPHEKGYRAAFYLGSGLALVAVIVVAFFVRVPKMAHYRE